MEKVIRISHKDMKEYIQKYSQKSQKESENKTDDIINDMDAPHKITFTDEEISFLIELMEQVVPDDVSETEIISNIKNTLKKSLETQKNEKR